MSTSQTNYLGAFIQIEDIKEEGAETLKIHTCSNPECKNHGKEVESPYCPKCGSEILLCECNVPFQKYWSEVLYELGIDNDLNNPTSMLKEYGGEPLNNLKFGNIFLSEKEGCSYLIQENFTNFFEIDKEKNQQMIKKFKSSDEIKILIEYAEKQNLKYEIGFGFISYYS